MRYTIVGRNIEVTPGLREAVEDKIGKLDRYFTPDTEVNVTMSVQRERQNIEVTIPIKGSIIRAEESSNDMYASIDGVVDKLERQIHKYKTRVNRKSKGAGDFADLPAVTEVVEEKNDDFVKPIKVKQFTVKPMDEEEAIMQMELIGHDFFVFLNAEDNAINVVYKRHDNSYGLIQPQFN